MHLNFYVIGSVVLVSLISLVGVLSLFIRKRNFSKILLIMVSLSAGTLFGGTFLHLLPEAISESGFTTQISLLILAGVLVFFVLEKFIHMHHHHHCHDQEHDHPKLHEPRAKHIGILNLAGDAIHNFLDGLIIAGSYLISIPLGVATTIAVIFHEVPQELADFGVLLYAGYTKKKALFLNFLSAAVSIVGAIIGLILGSSGENFIQIIVPFAAGGFIYIAGSNLIPELHKHCKLRESFWHFVALSFGILIMYGLTHLGH